MQKRVALIGITGCLGSYLLSKNFGKNFEIIGFNRNNLDLFDIKNLEMKLSNFDFLINCAAYTNVIAAEKDVMNNHVNFDAVKNLATVCKKNYIHLIHMSTNMVFTPNEKLIPNKEIDIYESKPIKKYGVVKRNADLYIMSNIDKYTIIRAAWLHSSSKNNFISKMLKLGNELNVSIDEIGNLSTGNMVFRFIQKVLERNIIGDFNLCTNEAVSRFKLMEIFLNISKKPISIKPALMKDFGVNIQEYQNLIMSNEKVKKVIELYSIKKELEIWFNENKEYMK